MAGVPKKSISSLTALIALSIGCNDFATPAELDRPQVLAIVAEPPALAAGERAALSVVVAGPEGQIEPAMPMWASVAPVPNAPAVGTVERDGDTYYYVAPPMQPAMNPTLALVEVTVDVGRDAPLVANKALAVGSLILRNPVVESFTADGTDVLDAEVMSVAAGATVPIEVGVVDGLPLDGFVSWYSTVGEIELYRSNPTEIVFDTAAEGWLFAVVRDGMGGIAWTKVRVVVE